MILLLGGTREAREVARVLSEHRIGFVYSTQTSYGARLLEDDSISVLTGSLDLEKLCEIIKERHITIIVDVTHPYAKQISINAMKATLETNITYLRFERGSCKEYGKNVIFFSSQKKAADYLKNKAGRILLTTGSRGLDSWKEIDKERLILRILPTSEILKKCESLGFLPKQIIAEQGPFSYQENLLTLKKHHIRYLVTKDGGKHSKIEDKLRAARDNGATVIMIRKPELCYPRSTGNLETLIDWIENG